MHPPITITAADAQEAAKDDETIDRAEAERRLRELGAPETAIADGLDNAHRNLIRWAGASSETGKRANAVLRAYVRGLDAKPAPIPDVSYALTILRERIAVLDNAIAVAASGAMVLSSARHVFRQHRTTLEQTRDDLRKIERALLDKTSNAEAL